VGIVDYIKKMGDDVPRCKIYKGCTFFERLTKLNFISSLELNMKKNILFLCTGNSCRSQMGEGLGRKFKGDLFNFYSAGTKKHGMNPHAMKVMQEIDIDISSHFSKTTDEIPDVKFDYVFTVCGDANENCPYFPGGKIIHHGFDDPPRLTADIENEEDKLVIYRRVRDEIRDFVMDIESYRK
jgi:arsenate reductase